MKHNSFFKRMLSGVMTLAMLLSMVVTVSASNEARTLYAFKASGSGATDAEKIQTNHVFLNGNATSCVKGATMTKFTADGTESVRTVGFVNKVATSGGVFFGLPMDSEYTRSPYLSTENLKLEFVEMPELTLGTEEVVNVEFEYIYDPNEFPRNVAYDELLQVYVSVDGVNYLPDTVGIRWSEMNAVGQNASKKDVIFYTIQTENLLDIPGVAEAGAIKKLMIMPDGEDSRAATGQVIISYLNVNAYEYEAQFNALFPAQEAVTVDPDTLRQLVVDEGQRTATEIMWAPDEDFATNDGKNSYTADLIWLGPVYEKSNAAFREQVMESVENGVYTLGMDCQTFAFNALSRVSRTNANGILYYSAGSGMRFVDGLKTSGRVRFTDVDVIDYNSKNEMFAAYAKLQPGDIIYTYDTDSSVHGRIVVSVDVEEQKVYCTEQGSSHHFDFLYADGSTATYSGYYENMKNHLENYPGSEILQAYDALANKGYTFEDLYQTDYVPCTLTVYDDGVVELEDVAIVVSPANGDSMTSGAAIGVASNYPINRYDVVLKDSTGKTLYTGGDYSGHIRTNAKVFHDAGLDEKLTALPGGDYSLTVSVTSGPFTEEGQSELPVTTETSNFSVVEKVVGHAHTCSHANTNHGGVAAADWKPLSEELSKFANGGLPLSAGHYYLDEDITLPTATGTAGKKSNHIQINGNATICLNGHTLNSGDGQQYIIYMNGAYTLDICDCSAEQDGEITGLTMGSAAGSTFSAIIARGKGTVNLYGGNITGNKGYTAVFVAGSSFFNMYGGKITGNEIIATTQGAVHMQNSSATFNMYGGEISGNVTAAGVSQVTGAGTFTQPGGTITENAPAAPTTYTVSVGTVSNGTVTVDKESGAAGETVTVTATPDTGYALAQILVDGKVISGTTFTISGDHVVTAEFVEIPATSGHTHSCSHTNTNHGAVAQWVPLSSVLADNGPTTLNAGHYYLDEDIDLPASTLSGGMNVNHIKVYDDTTICLNGHTLTAGDGQQYILWLGDACTLDICDCSAEQSGMIGGLEANTTASFYYTYAAISARAKGTVNLYGGTITGNAAGAAVYVAADSSFNMYDGAITGNASTSPTQGAVHVAAKGTFNMYGGEISDNDVPSDLTQVTGAGTINKVGGTVIENAPATPATYTVTVGAVSNGTVTVDKETGAEGETVTITATPDAGYELVQILVDGAAISGNTFTISGDHVVTAEFAAEVVTGHQHSCTQHSNVSDWKLLRESLAAAGPTELPAGNYYLDADITLPTPTVTGGMNVNHIKINGNTTICLNGYSINAGDGQQYILYLTGAYTLDICDCSATQSGEITGLEAMADKTIAQYYYTYAPVAARAGGTVNLYGGTITGNSAGAAVYVAKSSFFNMYGGKITGNAVTSPTQGAVHTQNNTATFNMYGGEISGNEVAADLSQVTGAGTINKVGGTIIENPCNHAASKLTVVAGKEATCTEDGYTESKVCSCGEVVVKAEVVPAGHKMETIPAQEPTYEAAGWHEYTKCSVCGHTEGYVEIPALTPDVPKYAVTVASGIKNGTVTVDVAEGEVGTTVTVTATPDVAPKAGSNKTYDLIAITVNGEVIEGNTFQIAEGENVVSAIFGKAMVTMNSLSLSGKIVINTTSQFVGFDNIDVAEKAGLLVWDTPVEKGFYDENAVVTGLMPAGSYNNDFGYLPEYKVEAKGIPAKEYADELYLCAYIEVAEGLYAFSDIKTYSVQTYCKNILSKPTSATNTEALKQVCAQILHYGAAAQQYFKYKTDNLANDVTKVPQLADYPAGAYSESLLTELDPIPTTAFQQNSEAKRTMAGLVLSDAIIMKLTFAYNGDFDENAGGKAEMLVWRGVEGELTEENVTEEPKELKFTEVYDNKREFAAETDGIPAKEYGDTVYACAKFTDAEGNVTYSEVTSYSVETYAKNTIGKASNPAALKELCRRMVVYGEAAKTYFGK